MISALLEQLLNSKRLSEEETREVFSEMFNGDLNESQIAALLTGWRMLGESERELGVGAELMREKSVNVSIPESGRPLVDNCGTGGDGSNSFNISTASAIVAASCGAKVAKHGNRSVSSKCGSADLLFAAGFPDTLSPECTTQLLADTGFTFFFAPHFHPVMKFVMPVRKAMGVRTIFNLLGPLANPLRPEAQLIGVGSNKFMTPMAGALVKLGVKNGLVVYSRDGLDEISPAAATDAIHIKDGRLENITINPAEYGVNGDLDDLAGGDATVNHAILRDLLAGQVSTVSQTICLNAGAVLWISGMAKDLQTGFTVCGEALASGRTKKFFADWLQRAQAMADATNA